MTPDTRRAERFDAATRHLDWCAQVPHTVDQIVGIYAERTAHQARPLRHGMTNDEILSSITAHSGGGGKGGHSDPTASAALYGEPDAIDDDGTLAEIRATITTLYETACELDDLCTMTSDEPLWRPPSTDPTLTGQIRDTVSRLHHCRPLLDLTAQVHPHADWLLTTIDDTAAWLHDKARGIWDQHHGDRLPVAEQKPLTECTNCKGHGITGTLGTLAGLCPRCSRFQSDNKCLPDQRIVRAWDRGSKSIPNGWVIECKAGAKIKPGRSRAS